MKLHNPFPFLRRNKELFLGILALLIGGGGAGYSFTTESDNVDIRHHTGQQTADNTLDIQVMESRIRKLEAQHP